MRAFSSTTLSLILAFLPLFSYRLGGSQLPLWTFNGLYSARIKQKIKFLLNNRFLVVKLKINDTDQRIFQDTNFDKICGGSGGFAGLIHIYYDCKAGL